MRAADKQGVRVVAIVGEAERAGAAATLRDMVAKRDLPQAVPFAWSAEQVRAFLTELQLPETAASV